MACPLELSTVLTYPRCLGRQQPGRPRMIAARQWMNSSRLVTHSLKAHRPLQILLTRPLHFTALKFCLPLPQTMLVSLLHLDPALLLSTWTVKV